MNDAPTDLYRHFFRDEPGVCRETGEGGAHAFADQHEIECAPGSRYDTQRFVWLTSERGPIGYRSDRWIEQALHEQRIGLHASSQGVVDIADPAILQAAFLMGAERVASVLALPTDADGCVAPSGLDGLSPHLHFVLERWMKAGSLPLVQLVERMLHSAGQADEPEAAGRLAMVVQAALHNSGGGRAVKPIQAIENAGLREAADRWVEKRMQDRRRRLERERDEPILVAELAAAVEALSQSGDGNGEDASPPRSA